MTTNDCTFAGCETLVTVEQCASTCGITSGIDSCNYFAWKASGRGGVTYFFVCNKIVVTTVKIPLMK